MAERASVGIEPGDLVCVTGGAGFVGSHVVGQLLEAGYRVRATVRDPSDDTATAHLRARDPEGRLEIVAADLTDPASLDAAVADCPYVCHVAASVRLRARNPQRDIVDVAVEGTKRVLDSIGRAGVARRVVLTSSTAAVVDDTKPSDFVHDESHWNESCTLEGSPYPLGKYRAERAAWDHHAKLPEDDRYGLVTINPTLVLGPILAARHARSSPVLIRDLLSGRYPMIPNFHFGVVDVRDVAAAHVLALQRPEAAGRYVLYARGAWLTQMTAIVRDAFPDHPVPRRRLPDPLMYVVSLFDKRLTWSFLRRNLSTTRRVDNRKSREELGVQYRPLAETVRDTAAAFVELGLDRRR